MFSTDYRPHFQELMDDHEITKFVRREFHDEDMTLVYFKPTGYYGIVRWEVRPPNDKAKFRELISIGKNLEEDFTKDKVSQLRLRLGLSLRKMLKDMVGDSKEREAHRRYEEESDKRARAHVAKICRVKVKDPRWQPDPIRLSFGS